MATPNEFLSVETKDNEHEPASKRKRKQAPSASVESSLEPFSSSVLEPPMESDESEVTSGIDSKRKRKLWEQWSADEIRCFFRAVYEYGKDFIAIMKFFQLRKKKKTKEQIKDFYYRTFHKLEKFVQFPKNTPKIAAELYCIVNFSQLWKKLGISRMYRHLAATFNELVHKGVAKTKVKGKYYKFFTPNCKALRKLNESEIMSGAQATPEKIWIEFYPSQNRSSWKVQSAAHNPLLKLYVPVEKSLKSVFKFLRKRWSSPKIRLKESLLGQAEQYNDYTDTLKLAPLKGSIIKIPAVKEVDVVKQGNISFDHYQKRHNLRTEVESSAEDNVFSPKSDEAVISETHVEVPLQFDPLNQSFWEQDNLFDQPFAEPEYLEHGNIEFDSQDEESPEKIENLFDGLSEEETVKKIQTGWNENDCGDVSIGHLYSYFGTGQSLKLNYHFEDSIVSSRESLNSVLEALLSVGRSFVGKKARAPSNQKNFQCQCGHVCPLANSPGMTHKLEPLQSQTLSPNSKSSPVPSLSADENFFKHPVVPFRKRAFKTLSESADESQQMSNLQNRTKKIRPRKLSKNRNPLLPDTAMSVSSVLPVPTSIQITIGEQPSHQPAIEESKETGASPFVNFGRDVLNQLEPLSNIEMQQSGQEPFQLLDGEFSNISISDLLTTPIKVSPENMLLKPALFSPEVPNTIQHEPGISQCTNMAKNAWGNSQDSFTSFSKVLASSADINNDSSKTLSEDTINRLLNQLNSVDTGQPHVSVDLADMNEVLAQLKTPVKSSGEKSVAEDTFSSVLSMLQSPQKNEKQQVTMNIGDLNELLMYLKTPVKKPDIQTVDNSSGFSEITRYIDNIEVQPFSGGSLPIVDRVETGLIPSDKSGQAQAESIASKVEHQARILELSTPVKYQ